MDGPIDLDDILPLVGEFGRYQKLLLWLVCLPACIPCGFCAFNQLFMADVPPHHCKFPQALSTLSPDPRILAIPSTEDVNGTVYSSCFQYKLNWTEMFAYQDLGWYFSENLPNSSWPIMECQNGWEYNTTEIESSIVIDFDLVCGRDIYPTLGLVALNLGGPIGVYFFGVVNDRFGRRRSFFLCLTTLIVGNLSTAFAPNFWVWAFCRFIVGLTIPAVYQIPFIISLELVGPNYRSFVTVMTCLFYTLGLLFLALITYLVRDWRQLAIVTSLPFLLYYVYWWFLPESPRWLLAKGQLEEALKILEKLATVNNSQLPEEFTLKLKKKLWNWRGSVKKKKKKIIQPTFWHNLLPSSGSNSDSRNTGHEE